MTTTKVILGYPFLARYKQQSRWGNRYGVERFAEPLQPQREKETIEAHKKFTQKIQPKQRNPEQDGTMTLLQNT